MTALEEKMAPLRRRFVARACQDLSQLRAHQEDRPLPADELRSIVHRLAGSAGLFGYTSITDLAGKVESQLIESGHAPMLPLLVNALEIVSAEAARSSAGDGAIE